jgi:hypothetical protein
MMNILQSSSGKLTRTLGAPNDIVVAGSDFEGDGRADMVSLNPTSFLWTVATSSTNWQTTFSVTWGHGGRHPLAGTDFDGDGRADFVIYRQSDHTYRIRSRTPTTLARRISPLRCRSGLAARSLSAAKQGSDASNRSIRLSRSAMHPALAVAPRIT